VDSVGRADPGDPCADDQHVGVFGLLVHPQLPLVRLGTTIKLSR
jgi:hypothetical protein